MLICANETLDGLVGCNNGLFRLVGSWQSAFGSDEDIPCIRLVDPIIWIGGALYQPLQTRLVPGNPRWGDGSGLPSPPLEEACNALFGAAKRERAYFELQ